MRQYVKHVWRALVGSLTLRMPFVFVLGYEWLYVLVVAGIITAFVSLLGSIAARFTQIPTFAVTPEAAATIRGFWVQSISATLGLLLAIYVAYVIIQGLAWMTALGIQHTMKRHLRFALVNLAWFVPWVAVFWFFVVALRDNYAATGLIILSVVFVHLTFILQHRAAAEPGTSIKQLYGRTFAIGIGRIHWFLIPYLLATIVFLVWSQVWWLVPGIQHLPFAAAVLAMVVFAPFFAWYKFYMHRLLAFIG